MNYSSARKKIVGTVLLLVLVVAGIYVFENEKNGGHFSLLNPAALSGTIYLTLDSSSDNTMKMYTLDAKTGALKLYLDDGNTKSQFITPAFSSDGAKVAFAYRPQIGVPYQIYSDSTAGGARTQITDTTRPIKREIAWNNDGTLLTYTAQIPNPNLNPLVPASWAVYIADLNGHSNYVARGIDPFFSPDGKTLFVLQNDGIYAIGIAPILSVLNTTDGTTRPSSVAPKKVVPSPEPLASQTMKISISADHSQLAWTDPNENVVRVYSISSWSPLTLKLEREIHTHAFWAVFSPDGAYLALQEVEWGTHLSNAKIAVYDLSDPNSQGQTIADLSKYDISYMWMTAWLSR